MYIIAAALYMIAATGFVLAYEISKDVRWGFPAALMMILSIFMCMMQGVSHGTIVVQLIKG